MLTSAANLERSIGLTSMPLHCGRKPGCLERTHTCRGKTGKRRTERAEPRVQPQTFLLLGHMLTTLLTSFFFFFFLLFFLLIQLHQYIQRVTVLIECMLVFGVSSREGHPLSVFEPTISDGPHCLSHVFLWRLAS